jgi:toxin ParE1/3/4
LTRHLNLLPAAISDLSDIWDYTIDRWSLKQARVYTDGLTDLLNLLCDHPEIAQRYGKSAPTVRVHRYRSHLVIFTADDSRTEIIRVVHARSNWLALLAQ